MKEMNVNEKDKENNYECENIDNKRKKVVNEKNCHLYTILLIKNNLLILLIIIKRDTNL